MLAAWVRQTCLAFPHVTETVQWGNDLVFKVAGKMFAVAALEPDDHAVSFKCTPEEYVELIERPGVVPAPYLARAYWVALETAGALPKPELRRLLRKAYDLVVAKLPKKTREALAAGDSAPRP
jgi:predicted DNA-binding protein (MmcQ/YjbR family)